MEALWIGIGLAIVITVVASGLYIKLKKVIVFPQRDACTCCGSTTGKTGDTGISCARQTFCETAGRCHDGNHVRLCFLFCIAGKNYNALLLSYKNEEEAEITELNRMWMKSVLEERFGYAVYDCDVMRGKGMHVRSSLMKTELRQRNH